MKLPEARRIARQLHKELSPYCKKFRVAGSVRRREPEPHDLDIVIIPKGDKERLIEALYNLGFDYGNKRVYIKGVFKGVKVQIAITKPKSFGATMLWATGPASTNIGMRAKAKKLGFKLSRWGLFTEDMKFISGSAREIRRILGMGRKVYSHAGPRKFAAQEGIREY